MVDLSTVKQILESDQERVVNLYLKSGWKIIQILQSGPHALYVLGWTSDLEVVHPDINP
jgi:hypothetical protein